MARPKNKPGRKPGRPAKVNPTVGGTRAKAGRKSVEVHFAALDAKLDQILALLHGETEVQAAPAPVAHPLVVAPPPVMQAAPVQAPPQLITPFQVSFIPPKNSQPDFAPPPLQQP